MRMYQSTEDGSMNILAACFDPSTDFLKGPAKQMKFDKGSSNKKVFWENSEEAFGSFDIC